MRFAVLALFTLVAACEPQPRSAAYFEGHPTEAARVISACTRGAQRGRECDAAREGEAAIKAKARLELFRKGFQ